jgi:polysaccharide export outer membrane protein
MPRVPCVIRHHLTKVVPRIGLWLSVLALLAGCSGSASTMRAGTVATRNAPPSQAAGHSTTANARDDSGSPAPDTNETYVIGAGDSLYIFVYDSPQLSMDVPVRPDGRISMPLVPEMIAAGKTPSKLARDLADRLKPFIRDPNVTVIVRGFVGPLNRQVRVIGQAVEPQAIPYRDHMTVLDVMIMTKGLTRNAAGDRAVIVRRTPNGQETIHVHLASLMKDGDISQNVEMQPGDTLIIPEGWF